MSERIRSDKEKVNSQEQIHTNQKIESLNTMAGAIAHNFNNNLMIILGFLDVSLDKLKPSDPIRHDIEKAKISAKKAAKLSSLMLTYVGQSIQKKEQVDVHNQIEQVLIDVNKSLNEKIQLVSILPPNLPEIKGDPEQIVLILSNLILNSIEAIEDNYGLITLKCEPVECDSDYLKQTFLLGKDLRQGLYQSIEISDNGSGMDRNTVKKIFDPFFTTKFTGRGLGLATVYGIIRGHNGTINVYSEPGLGTTIKLLLPAIERRKIARTKDSETLIENRKTGTILIIDDNEDVLSIGKEILEEGDFSVLLACSGDEGISVLKKNVNQIDGIILDMVMPGKDGLATFTEIREADSKVPVAVTSGFNMERVMEIFKGKDISMFINKPFRAGELISMMNDLVKK